MSSIPVSDAGGPRGRGAAADPGPGGGAPAVQRRLGLAAGPLLAAAAGPPWCWGAKGIQARAPVAAAPGTCVPAHIPHAARASEHGVAGPDAGAAARAPHLVPGRCAHRQQRAGLRALVPPGAAGPREAERWPRGSSLALQCYRGPGPGGPAEAAAALPV
uniref:Alternative protein FPGS n=1 Tax=Homo sapiens TaxID=9606 RepID=L8E999_HUMAN|nr:alternative protein FPGS [Homo sapiens]